MRLSTNFVLLAAASSPFIEGVYGWGAAGHEIVATIAQIHLLPSTLRVICDLLGVVPTDDSEATLRRQCHVSTIATWADRDKYRMRWSAPLHYVGAVGDHPRGTCLFPGEGGWAGSKGINVLDGIKNTTHILADWSGVSEHTSTSLSPSRTSRLALPGPLEIEAFKFLVHFVGDMHQPLHLTGRDRGGNSQKVYFENRQTNLHSAWDTAILTRLIRTVPSNYSRPLPDMPDTPSSQVEMSLRHAIYDPLIRRVMWEGVEGAWAEDVEEWLTCPAIAVNPNGPPQPSTLSILASALTSPAKLVHAVSSAFKERIEIQPDGPLVCPYYWSVPLHQLNCEYVWPSVLNVAASAPRPRKYPTLDTPEYMAALDKNLVMERLVAQGGLRLAGILNWLFADPSEV
ncbi:phospholipase C/P1 nuclease [Coprinellus micaceus]|uniref:Phospholipase C/P1 nuclease n=1 Tax=Coprinellus micaceus TaxID=71717 RepID=A0A4Y7T6F3_COPMI|nr:phospholipase C/P1 nuclease [Coprinellus micaceus]